MIRKPVLALTLLAIVGCSTSSNPDTDREKKLLSMASAEAQFIPDAKDRLSRQLNFAFDQTDDHQTAEARESLAHAVETLKKPEAQKLDWQIRIAGWVSVSQLSRGLKDTDVADAACDQAVALLRQIDPVSDRPRYVIGVANEVRELHGPEASAKLLEDSAPWTAQIKDQPTRRGALVDITRKIIICDDYTGALAAIRTDPDAAWRSDSLKQLADEFPPESTSGTGFPFMAQIGAVGGVSARAIPATTEQDQSPKTPYALPVDFQSVFQRQK